MKIVWVDHKYTILKNCATSIIGKEVLPTTKWTLRRSGEKFTLVSYTCVCKTHLPFYPVTSQNYILTYIILTLLLSKQSEILFDMHTYELQH